MKKIAAFALCLGLFSCETEHTLLDKDALRRSVVGTYITSWTTQEEGTRQVSLTFESQIVELPNLGEAMPFSLSIDGGPTLEGHLLLNTLTQMGGPHRLKGQLVRQKRKFIPINGETYNLNAITFRIDEDGDHALEGVIFSKSVLAAAASPMAFIVYFSAPEPEPRWKKWPDTLTRIP